MTKPHPDSSYAFHQLLSGLEALPPAAKDAVNFLIFHSDFVEEITYDTPITEDQLDELGIKVPPRLHAKILCCMRF